jgi:hypothetical protein
LHWWNSALPFICADSLHFVRQKKERRALAQSLESPCETSVFCGNMAAKDIQ